MCMCDEHQHHKYVAADMHDDGLGAQLQPKLTCIMEVRIHSAHTCILEVNEQCISGI